MLMMDELKPLFLYSSSKKVYAPIDEKDRRHNSAILMLSPDINTSNKLMNLPYIHNPNLFTSFYIDRDVMTFLDKSDLSNIEFDEQEEEAVSEAMLRNWNYKIKFKYDEDISIMDKKFADEVCNKFNIRDLTRTLRLTYVPEKIKIFIHPNISDLRKNAPGSIRSVYKDEFYSYSKDDEIHIVSKRVYDPEIMGGDYSNYIKNELIVNILMQANPDLSLIAVTAIAYNISGIMEYIDKNKNDKDIEIGTKDIMKFAKCIKKIIADGRMDIIIKYLKNSDLKIFMKYNAYEAGISVLGLVKSLFEQEISYFDRQKLLPSDFALPEKRKYPIHDEEHVRIAIKMFNQCDPSDEQELAKALIRRIDKFGITDIKMSASNRFKSYYDAEMDKRKEESKYKEELKNKSNIIKDKANEIVDKVKTKTGEFVDKGKDKIKSIIHKEEALYESSMMDSDFANICRICDHLSQKELGRITFYDTYRNSKFVIKRIIKLGPSGEGAAFLDVYQFPSKPEIAQIVIAVANDFRGQGLADEMVNELLDSDLHNIHNFNMYYWTAHPENEASINLALKHGFKDINKVDAYGRNVYINIKKPLDDTIDKYLSDLFDNKVVTESGMIVSEANDNTSLRLKQYLYNERLKNNREVILIYDKVKENNPIIKRAYIKLDMYKKQNIFVDLSYYHGLFLKNNTIKNDRGVRLYFDFINKLINNKEIQSVYPKQTIFIPVDPHVWGETSTSDIFDYKLNLNPISIILRLIRIEPGALSKAWKNKDIIFVGSRGYFKFDPKTFEMKNISRFKTNIQKLMSSNEPIEDEYEIDPADSSKARKTEMIDKIEQGTNIKIDNVSSTADNNTDIPVSNHLEISKGPISISGVDKNNIAIISLDPEGPDGYERITKTILGDIKSVNNYCMPK